MKVLGRIMIYSKFISATIIMLYKRPFRKEKEVVTFLIKVLK